MKLAPLDFNDMKFTECNEKSLKRKAFYVGPRAKTLSIYFFRRGQKNASNNTLKYLTF